MSQYTEAQKQSYHKQEMKKSLSALLDGILTGFNWKGLHFEIEGDELVGRDSDGVQKGARLKYEGIDKRLIVEWVDNKAEAYGGEA